MLKVVCRTEEGQLIFDCSHVEPIRLWPTIVAAFCAYYGVAKDFMAAGPGNTVWGAGLVLGTYSVSSSVVSGEQITADPASPHHAVRHYMKAEAAQVYN